MKPKKKAKITKMLQNFQQLIQQDSDDSVSVSSVEETNSSDEDNPTPRSPQHSRGVKKREIDAETKKLFAKYQLQTSEKSTVKAVTKKRKRNGRADQQPVAVYTVVLLEDANRDAPLSNKEHSAHALKGLVKEPVPLDKSLSAECIRDQLRKTFFSHLENKDFDILKKQGDKLIAPNLPKKAKLDGVNFAFVFYRKVVFLRPHASPSLLPNIATNSATSSTNCSEDSSSGTASTTQAQGEEAAPVYTVVLLEDCNRETPLSAKELSRHANLQLVQEPVPINKSHTEESLHEELRKIFEEKLQSKDFDILKKVGDKIMRPNLPSGAKLDGENFSYIFNKKTVFLRPHVSLAFPSSSDDAYKKDEIEVIEVENSNTETAEEQASDVILSDTEDDNEAYLQQLLLEVSASNNQQSQNTTDAVPPMINVHSPEISAVHTDNVPPPINDSAMLPANSSEMMYRTVVASLALNTNIGQNKAIKIMRGRPFKSLLSALKSKNFSVVKGIFFKMIDEFGVDEEAIDNGGVSKEVFTLAFQQIRLSAMFEGGLEYERDLALDNTSLRNKDYYYVGMLIAMAIVHHLPLPQFFSAELYSFIVSGKYARELSIESIMDPEIRNKVMAVEDSKDIHELRAAVINDSFVGGMSVTNVNVYTEKRKLFRDAMNYALNTRLEPAFKQLLEGLDLLGVLDLIRREPDIMKIAFVRNKEPLTSVRIKNLFQIEWSRLSQEKEQEDNIFLTFVNFLDDVEGGHTETKLPDFLQFVTGDRDVPPGGFVPQPTLSFYHNADGWRPMPESNVCGNILRLPVFEYSPDEFQKNMEEAIQTQCFGRK